MALVNCPECNHQVSASADACPNCGHPFAPPPIKEKVFTQSIPHQREQFPKWIFIPLGILGVVLLFVLIMFMRNDDTARRDIDVNINSPKRSSDRSDSEPIRPNQPEQVIVPPSTTTTTDTDPQMIPPDTQTTVVENESSNKGLVKIEARVTDRAGKTKPVDDEKFYLLDKQLENILREAGVRSVNGQTLVNSFGLSVLNPEKYPEVNKKSLDAINDHIKYDTLSNASGNAEIKGVEPGNYYLFAITKTADGFAVWSSPVSIKAGENRLVLPPARLTQAPQ